ncbi:hypothetical protein FRC04_009786 [Tulasnella sp. 424]|nr:hypothetical protein FRC04_009786 [Tulasnella sp. 424]
MSAPTTTTFAERFWSMSLRAQPADEDWEDANEDELDSFITAEQQIIPSIVSAIHSDDHRTRLIATIKIRRLLQRPPPSVGLQPVINSGLVPIVVEMLSSENTRFRAEAAWIVSNIASGTYEQTSTVVYAGAIPKLVALFPTDDTDIQETALWALGNIGGDCKQFRDMVVQAGGLKPPLDVLDAPKDYEEKLWNTASWVLSCYLTPRPGDELELEVTSQMIPVLTKFLRGTEEIGWDTIKYVVKALEEICANEAAAELTIKTGMLPRLLEFCTEGSPDLRYNAIRCVGQFTAGSEDSTDAAIEAGFLQVLKACIFHDLSTIRESACWAASNVAAGTLAQVHTLLDAGLLSILATVVRDKQEVLKPRNEATWALANLVNTAVDHPELINPLIEGGCIEALSDAMTFHYFNAQRLAVQSLQKILGIELRSQSKVIELLKAADGIARLRALRDGRYRNNRQSEVGRTAHEILKVHYPDFIKRARSLHLQNPITEQDGTFTPLTNTAKTIRNSGVMDPPIETTVVKELGSPSPQEQPVDENSEDSEFDEAELESFITTEQQIIPSIVNAIHSDDRHARLTATINIRRLLQKGPLHAGVQPVINSGLVPIVVEMLSSEDTKFRAEAAWIVSNIAAGTSEQTSTVVDAGAIPKLVAMFSQDEISIQDSALWALGNIGGDSARFRDMVVEAGGVKLALDVLDAPKNYKEKLWHTAPWVLSSYLTQRPGDELGLEVTSRIIPILTKFIHEPPTISWDTLGYAIKALDKICNDEAAAELTVATGILPRLVKLCTEGDFDLQESAILCVGQFVAGSEASTDATIEAGFLDVLKHCIGHQVARIREVACVAASNFARGSLTQVHALLDAGLLPVLVTVVRDRHELQRPRKEATWALADLANKALVDLELIDPLIEGGCIEAFSDAMTSEDDRTQSLAVQSLQKLLRIESRSQNKVLELLKAADGTARLRGVRDGRYRNNRGTDVGRTAHKILKDYYPDFSKRARV